MEPSSYEEIERRDWARVVRDPDSHSSEMYVIYGHVTQFDAATGTDAFRANTDGVIRDDWYDYEHNTLVVARDPDIVNDVLAGDIVKMHVEVVEAFTYETQIGGSTTVPLVAVNIIEIIGSSED